MRRAFTLIEMLVVLAVVGVLAALLFPAFAAARERARQTACLNNERQIGTALSLYLDQSDDSLPNWGVTTSLIYFHPYLTTDAVWICPSDPCPAIVVPVSLAVIGVRSYTMNAQVLRAYDDGPYSDRGPTALSDVRDPSALIAIAEKRSGAEDMILDIPGDILPPYGDAFGLEKQRHNGGSNLVFLDGHTRWMRFSQTMSPRILWVNDQAYWTSKLKGLPVNDFNDGIDGKPMVLPCAGR